MDLAFVRPSVTVRLALICVLAVAATGWAAEFRVDTVDGKQHTGQLLSLAGEQLQLQAGDQTIDLPIENIVRIAATQAPDAQGDAPDQPGVLVTLADGTLLAGDTFLTQDQKSIVRFGDDGEQSVETKWIRSVRLKPASDEFDGQWRDYLSKTYESDVLVIRKPSGTLDFFKGVVEQVKEASVAFQFDGQMIDVPRERVEGIVFFSTVPASAAVDPLCRVATFAGSHVRGRDIALHDGTRDDRRVVVTTSHGTSIAMPLESIQSIDFSAGKVEYLSDLEPAVVSVQPRIHSAIRNGLMALMYQPRRNESILGGSLSLEFHGDEVTRREYAKGMAVHSRTEVIWRLDGQFRKLKAVAGIDPRMNQQGHVRLEIGGDGKVLFETEIVGKENPLDIDVDIAGVNRLTILVDYGDQTDIADHLNLCDLRVTK